MAFLLRKTICQTLTRRANPSLSNSVQSQWRYSTSKDGESNGVIGGETNAANDSELHSDSENDVNKSKLGGFAQAFLRQTEVLDPKSKTLPPQQTFAALLRNSKFIDIGDAENKIVKGTVFHIVNDDLYIDFGWKFHCVCSRPRQNSEYFIRGTVVNLRIKELELSTLFLGSKSELTLLEADCELVGIISVPGKDAETLKTVLEGNKKFGRRQTRARELIDQV